jgi:hypothetical protein
MPPKKRRPTNQLSPRALKAGARKYVLEEAGEGETEEEAGMTQHQIDETYNGIPDYEEEKDAKNYTPLLSTNNPLRNNMDDEALEIVRQLKNHQTTFTMVSPEKEDSSGPILSEGSILTAIKVSRRPTVPTGQTQENLSFIAPPVTTL